MKRGWYYIIFRRQWTRQMKWICRLTCKVSPHRKTVGRIEGLFAVRFHRLTTLPLHSASSAHPPLLPGHNTACRPAWLETIIYTLSFIYVEVTGAIYNHLLWHIPIRPALLCTLISCLVLLWIPPLPCCALSAKQSALALCTKS